MRIDIQYLNTEPDWDTKKYITEKLNKFQSNYNWIIDVDVYLENENNDHNNSKVVELKVMVPGDTLFAESMSENFHQAAKQALQSMGRQLKKYNMRNKSPHLERKTFHKISSAL
ncbi:MAG: ribosome-associated translation inhibitor RaiA [Bacteroidetes bacterium]|nr:ribosome-associated translation inhibitor RaiA [Bacteroidota bacterium]